MYCIVRLGFCSFFVCFCFCLDIGLNQGRRAFVRLGDCLYKVCAERNVRPEFELCYGQIRDMID